MYRYLIFISILLINFSVAFAQPLSNISEEELSRSVEQMSLNEKVGQLFMIAFRTENDRPLTTVTQAIKEQIQKYHLGGVILFGENFVNIEQTVRLNHDLQHSAGRIPLFVAVDQEGGRVNRFRYGTNLPGNMALGASGEASNAYTAGHILGQELAALGINLDLAPVLDINGNQDNPVIGIRSFGSTPELVGQMGAAYINGLHAGGVMAAIKHFPGHGDTSVDSHLGLPTVLYDESRLCEIELKPFRQNLVNTDMVMAAHIAFPAIDNTKVLSKKDGQPVFLPATLSYKILTELLRQNLGYAGVIITDALEMKAITEHFGPEEAAVRAINAGADILLMPGDLAKAYRGVVEAVKNGTVSEARLNQSVARILRLKSRITKNEFIGPDAAQEIVGSQEHKAEEKRLAEDAVTLLKNVEHILPLPPKSRLVLFAPWQDTLAIMREAALSSQENEFTAFAYEKKDELTIKEKSAIEEADYIILATYSSTLDSRTPGKSPLAAFAVRLSAYANSVEKKLIVIAMGTPYDILYLSDAKAYLAVYGANQPNIEAGMSAVFGGVNPQGKLPVNIEGQAGILYKIGSGLSY